MQNRLGITQVFCAYGVAGVLLASGVAIGGALDGSELSRSRMFHTNRVIPATLADVWMAWTDETVLASILPDAAHIDLRPGGAYEWYFDMSQPAGSRGAEGCTVLSFVPGRMLAFTWNAPPSIPNLRNANARTQVVVTFADLGTDGVQVDLYQHGYGQGADWDKYYDYFKSAWPHVLDKMHAHFVATRGLESRAQPPAATERSRDNGDVRIISTDGPGKRQQFEVSIPVPPDRVWRALATTEGLRLLMHPEAEVELRLDGKYAIWPGATNKVLAFLPGRMLSVSGSAPEQFPEVRKGGTWAVYEIEETNADRTLLRLTTLGWRDGVDEWDRAFDYFLEANAAYLQMVRDKLSAGEGTLPATSR